ncbi:TonB-dependent receptor [Oecophyllibacter saccharovorans]|nr:TonB-dependent siderophore receptor [Oecophyllibacter saccharovorans]
MSSCIRRCLKPVSAVLSFSGTAGFGAFAAEPPAPASQSIARAHPQAGKEGVAGTQAGTAAHNASHNMEARGVEQIHVTAHPFNTLGAGNDVGGRLPQDILHTPRTIDVIPHALMVQENVRSLDQALKNVPGITSSVGEGAGGLSGDQFLIRGFAAQNDIYEDGLRDFGVYTRDSFNYEAVNVIKGPSSEIFGNGTTGGAINIVTKTPRLNNREHVDFDGGSAMYFRGMVDVNRQLSDTSAFRVEGVVNSNNVVGRDKVFSHRWGIAPSLAFGLGTDTTLLLQIMHQSGDGKPDYGVPVVPGADHIGRPVTQMGIPRSNWYGKDQDHDRTQDTMETVRLKHRFNDHLVFHNDLRFGEYGRDFEASKAACGAACARALLAGEPQDGWVSRATGGGGPGKNVGGAPQPYKQDSWSFQDVASTVYDFRTGPLRHQLVGGFDIEYVHDQRHQYTFLTPIPAANLLHPDADVGPLVKVRGDNARGWRNLVNLPGLGQKADSSGYAFDAGIFLYDQIWFTQAWSLKGGFRWDRWQTGYNATGGNPADPNSHFNNTTNVINPTASLMYMPTARQTYYFTYATSTTPTGMYVTSGAVPIRPPGQLINKPEHATLFELGAKISAFHDRMGFTASLFRLTKDNALSADPATGQTISTGATQRNQGLELSVSGNPTRNWNISATYALYDPRTLKSQSPNQIGKMMQYVPHNQATLWTAYRLWPNTPWNVMVGGGVTWRQRVWLDLPNTARVPANVEFDAMIEHRISRHWRLSLNGYNLANRLNYGSLFVNRVTPAPGRAFIGRLTLDY